jgi:hypothetical protein
MLKSNHIVFRRCRKLSFVVTKDVDRAAVTVENTASPLHRLSTQLFAARAQQSRCYLIVCTTEIATVITLSRSLLQQKLTITGILLVPPANNARTELTDYVERV